MGSTSNIFAGSSRYSSDFRQLIDRAAGIASLPMLQMQNAGNLLRSRSDALNSLDAKVASAQNAIASLGTALGMNSYHTTVSDSAVLSATVADGVKEGTYTVEVTDLGSHTNTVSKPPGAGLTQVADPALEGIGASGPFKLYINTTDDALAVTVTPSGTSLNDLADAINNTSPDVRATVVNMGGSSGADYRLSIQHARYGANTIELKDALGNPILNPVLPAGSPVKYKINGSSEISNDTRTVTLAPHLTLNLEGKSPAGVAATVEVSRNANGVQNALTSFVQAYNALVSELDLHRGEGAGVLKGDSILAAVGDSLRSVTGYSVSTGRFTSLTSLGFSFDDKGKLSLDAATFNSATEDNFDDLSAFLGSTTGGGLLTAATNAMNSLEDSTSGFLKLSIDTVETQIADQDKRIEHEQARVDELRAVLQKQMSAADALIASLEQQVRYFTDMFESMRVANQTFN